MSDEKKVLADIILSAVLHPADNRYEIVRREVLDRARFMLDQEDIEAAAARARARREGEV